jgi:hypothetical protein
MKITTPIKLNQNKREWINSMENHSRYFFVQNQATRQKERRK